MHGKARPNHRPEPQTEPQTEWKTLITHDTSSVAEPGILWNFKKEIPCFFFGGIPSDCYVLSLCFEFMQLVPLLYCTIYFRGAVCGDTVYGATSAKVPSFLFTFRLQSWSRMGTAVGAGNESGFYTS